MALLLLSRLGFWVCLALGAYGCVLCDLAAAQARERLTGGDTASQRKCPEAAATICNSPSCRYLEARHASRR